ncbi:MAG TPA: CopG family transcriptional regulator [Candidatus Solibacter sp.]|jgi:hypothetical protein|nr:CopG family transcriptional regulator [Candidatus Solibacter sp.]
MASTRTQIYLTAEQRAAIDARIKRDGKSLAWIVREALDQYLAPKSEDFEAVLDRTFGSIPDMEVPPRSEWDRYPAGVDFLRDPRESFARDRKRKPS